MKKILITFFILSLFVLPLVVGAEEHRLVPCDDDCGFNHLVELVNNIINFLIFYVSIPVAAIVFAVAGFKYVTAAGNESKIKEAHGMFSKVVVGLIIALSAFLIVELITSNLLGDDVNIFLRTNFIGG
ncbi:hypothetical protein COB55_01735 [Candidatus Wolfebacteria bacterium]|nr:MAG: hypothetical protein COB55_01735 [Candidatus Wolfebacteria bacterium]